MLTIVNLVLLTASFALAVALYVTRERGVRIQSTSLEVDYHALSRGMWQLRQRESRFHYALVVVILGSTLVTFLGTYDLFNSWDQHGHLVPPDAPQAVTVFLAILAGVTAAIAALAGAWEKIIRARGDIEAQLRRANNDGIRAMAQMERARRGMPPELDNSDEA